MLSKVRLPKGGAAPQPYPHWHWSLEPGNALIFCVWGAVLAVRDGKRASRRTVGKASHPHHLASSRSPSPPSKPPTLSGRRPTTGQPAALELSPIDAAASPRRFLPRYPSHFPCLAECRQQQAITESNLEAGSRKQGRQVPLPTQYTTQHITANLCSRLRFLSSHDFWVLLCFQLIISSVSKGSGSRCGTDEL